MIKTDPAQPLSDRKPRRRRAKPLWLFALTVVGSVAAVTAGCGSMPKHELEESLLALNKNAPVAALGLQRTEFEFDGEAQELLYVHVPAASSVKGRAPIVLVHGTPSTLFTWGELSCGNERFAGLCAERDVYLIEVIGHGVAPAGPEPTTFQACADYVAGAVRALGLERAHLVGQSYGGEFAWRAALDHPELFTSLAIMSSSGIERRAGDWLPEEIEMRENGLADIGYLINSRERVGGALEPHFRTIPPDRVDEFFLVCENKANWKAMVDLAQDENGEREDEIARISLPTLLLWGSDDLAYPPEYYAARFDRDIPDARLILVDGAGHYPHEEQPAVVAARLNEFYSMVEGR